MTEKGKERLNRIAGMIPSIAHRGPDHFGVYQQGKVALGHTRLSIIDVSDASNQPFVSRSGQEAMVFNGEIFNYKTLGALMDCRTTGDVEVLLELFSSRGTACLEQLNGFFAFACYSQATGELHLVRDRLGIKPLYYYLDEDVLVFASEIKAILKVVGPQKLNKNALYNYFRFNYIPGPDSIFENIRQLPSGHYMQVKQGRAELKAWYDLETKASPQKSPGDLKVLLTDAVSLRLQADVPVGCFLSGGVDSSIISAIAARQHNDLHTFSIGFKDEPFFDETQHAELVARHIHSKHHTFKLGNDDLFDNLHNFLNSIDEPFADSSALNVYILAQYTKAHVKVSLSGDGADELFMGYNKHRAEWLANHSYARHLEPLASPLLKVLPKSRQGFLSNKFRQLDRFYASSGLAPKDRYISWAGISSTENLSQLFTHQAAPPRLKIEQLFDRYDPYKATNLADLDMVLADDMLVKVDRMSMRHGLEVRNPFLDYRVVELALGLPLEEKINKNRQKVILQKAFSDLLPADVFLRKKKGFEVPLLKWFNKELRSSIENNWLSRPLIEEQGLFNNDYTDRLRQQLYSTNPGDIAAKVWAMIVFQQWYANHKDLIDA